MTEKTCQQIADFLPNAISIIGGSKADQIIYVNDAWENLTGYTREESRTLNPIELVHSDLRDTVLGKAFRRLKGEKVESHYQLKMLTKNQNTIWVDFYATKIEYLGKPAILTASIDITKEKKYQTKLKLSEERYRTTLDNMLEGCQIIGFDWRYIYINDTVAKHSHTTKENLIGRTMMDVYPGIEQTEMFQNLNLCMENRTPKKFENEFQYPDGSKGWFDLSVEPVIEGIFILSIDKTEQKKVEHKINLLNEQFLAMTNSNIVGIVLAGSDGTIYHTNDYYLNLLGFNREDFENGKVDWRKITPKEWLPADENAIQELNETGTCAPYEKEYFKTDGSRVSVLITDMIVPGPEKKIAAFVLDITQQKESEKSLRESEEKLRLFIEHAPAALAMFDTKMKYLAVSKRWIEDYNMSVDDFLGKSHYKLFPEIPEEWKTMHQRGLNGEIIKKDNDKFIRIDGTVQWLNWEIRPWYKTEDKVGGILIFSEDITSNVQNLEIETARLHLFEYAITHETELFLEEALNKAEELTNSMGAFFHFIENDENTISKHAWSKRTKDELCKLPPQKRHLNVKDGGVWTEAIEKREPVIHNHYKTLHNKKGFPEKHFNLIRELVVPVIRLNKVVAVLAVANKNTDYEKQDVKTIKLIADVIWESIERKRAEEALRISEERFRVITENSADAIFIVDQEGRYTYANQTGLELLDISVEELSKLSIADTSRNDDLEQNLNNFESLKKSGHLSIELELMRSDGSTVPVDVNAVTLPNGFVFGSCRDITDRRKAILALRESEEKYRQLIEQSNDAIYLMHDNIFELINKKFIEMSGYTLEDLTQPGFSFMDLVAPKSKELIMERMKQFVSGNLNIPNYEFTVLSKDGKEIDVEASMSYIPYSNGIATQGFLRDITKRKQLELQLRQTQKMDAIGRLAGGVAHDFNNLLTVINGYSEMLMLRELPEHLFSPIEEIKNAGERAKKLTAQLLAFSRKQIIKPKILDLNKVIADEMKMLGRLLGEDIEISTILHSKPIIINADEGQIDQVIMNITINARDAMPLGGKLTIETSIKKFDEDYLSEHLNTKFGTYAMLAITDTGIGMNKETRTRIFEPFFTTKGRDKGTGLGLSTVFGIVKQNNGFIYVYSEENQGTTFKVYIPLLEDKNNDFKEKMKELVPSLGSETILLVEDDHGVRRITEKTLIEYGYKVISATNGEEGLRKFKENKNKINLVLTDIIMPLMSGKELAVKLKVDNPDLKVIFFSGYTDDSIVHHGILEESVEFIQKPYSHRELLKKIREVLDN